MNAEKIYIQSIELVYRNLELPFGAKQEEIYSGEYFAKKNRPKFSASRDNLSDRIWNFYKSSKQLKGEN
ncbi:MAG: hypothetical protein IPO06_09200 [Leptospiraceae bacterium]|nr:hypothetical protein [Leptospiraceae bacterium]